MEVATATNRSQGKKRKHRNRPRPKQLSAGYTEDSVVAASFTRAKRTCHDPSSTLMSAEIVGKVHLALWRKYAASESEQEFTMMDAMSIMPIGIMTTVFPWTSEWMEHVKSFTKSHNDCERFEQLPRDLQDRLFGTDQVSHRVRLHPIVTTQFDHFLWRCLVFFVFCLYFVCIRLARQHERRGGSWRNAC